MYYSISFEFWNWRTKFDNVFYIIMLKCLLEENNRQEQQAFFKLSQLVQADAGSNIIKWFSKAVNKNECASLGSGAPLKPLNRTRSERNYLFRHMLRTVNC